MDATIQTLHNDNPLLTVGSAQAESAMMSLLRDFRRDFSFVNDGRYVSVEMVTDKKSGTVLTLDASSLSDEKTGTVRYVRPGQWNRNDLIAFKVIIWDYMMAEIDHEFIGKRKLVEVKTTFTVFANSSNVVFSELVDGVYKNAALLLSTLGDTDAVKSQLTHYINAFVNRVVKNAPRVDARVGWFNNQETVYGLYLKQQGKTDASMKKALKS